MVTILMNYSKKLIELRNKYNLTQQDIANILNIDRVTYNHYENEYDTIPLKHLNTLSNYYHLSIDYLLGLSNNKENNIKTKDIDNHIFGQRLKEFRKKNKLTQEKLAQILNTVHPVICNYEKGKYLITTSFLYTICKKYHISADYLLGKID